MYDPQIFYAKKKKISSRGDFFVFYSKCFFFFCIRIFESIYILFVENFRCAVLFLSGRNQRNSKEKKIETCSALLFFFCNILKFYCTFSSTIWSAIGSSPLQFLTFFFFENFFGCLLKICSYFYMRDEKNLIFSETLVEYFPVILSI